LLTLTDKEGEEIKYTADILFEEEKVIVSTLSIEQKEKVRTKGYNNDFWGNIPWRDYLVYTASGITVVMVPLTLIGWVMSCISTCHFKKKLNKAAKKISRKSRQRENDLLLQRINL